MLKNLIELVWPSLEGEPTNYNQFLDENVHIDEKNIDNCVEFARIMYENQNSRIATIESKSSIFIGFFGTVIALLSFALKDVLSLENKGVMNGAIIFFGSLLIIYILQVIRYSIKALERKGYHSLDESDFLHGDKRATAISIINKVKNNYDTINEKVDYMVMAHEFTKRVIGVVFLSVFFIIMFSCYKYYFFVEQIFEDLSELKFDLRWSDFVMFLMIIFVFYTSLEVRSLNKKIKNCRR